MRFFETLLLIVIVCTIFACEETEQFEDEDEDEMEIEATQQALNGDRHEKATRMGVAGWVNSTVSNRLQDVSTIGDENSYWKNRSESHFDNCYWRESILRYRDVLGYAVNYAVRWNSTGSSSDLDRMYESLGYGMHIVQDFYAHSNWVETHSTGTIELFNSTTPPSNWYSGRYTNSDDSGSHHCRPGTPHHNEMNKDKAGTGNREEAFFDAALSTTRFIQQFGNALRNRLGSSKGNSLLNKLGFYTTYTPSKLNYRSDYRRTKYLGGTNWGRWLPSVYCRPGSYVAAFRQRVEAKQGSGDDTAMNGVDFFCRTASGVWTDYLNPWEGLWGSRSGWSYGSTAQGPFKSAELKVEESKDSGDDTSANGVRFKTVSGAMRTASNDQKWGYWRAPGRCEPNEAICGVGVRVEAHIGAGGGGNDDTALNNIKLQCCSL